MAERLSAGPVFAFEWMTRARRWQGYAARSLFVAALLVGLALVWQSSAFSGKLTSASQLAAVGQGFFVTLANLQLWLVLLVAPAATSGAICLDRARGSLDHIMTTDLSDAEVVLGKLAARLVPVLILAACALPVSALGMLLGGIDPTALAGSFAIACGLAALGCSLALLLSVWVSKAHEVMTVVFAIWGAWLVVLPMAETIFVRGTIPAWLELTHPFWLAMAPYENPGVTSLLEPLLFALACLAISAGLSALAVARLRPACLALAGRAPERSKVPGPVGWARGQVRWWRGPSLDANPVLWREWHRARPSRWTRAVWWSFATVSSIASLVSLWIIRADPPWGGEMIPMMVMGLQVCFGLLLVSASAATTLSEERVRGSLDVLMSTPVATGSILRGKWRGAFRRVPWLAFWPTCLMLAMLPEKASLRDVGLCYAVPILILGQGAALVSLGLALATWFGRRGVAVTWTIALFIGSVIGWPILSELLPTPDSVDNPGEEQVVPMIVLFGSPFANVAFPALMLEEGISLNPDINRGVIAGACVWAVAYPAIAALLFLATRLTFDRCLGRSPEHPRTPPESPRRAFKGSGWRIPGAGVRPAIGVASSGPPPR